MSPTRVWLHRHRAGVAAAALLVAIAVAAGWWWKTRGGPGAVGTRLAVLPFENLTGDPEQAYLADGIHESLITDLARLSGFSRVIARPSVMSYAKTTKRLADDRERAGGRRARHRLRDAGGREAQGHGAPDQGGKRGARLVGELRAGAPRHPLAPERDRPGHRADGEARPSLRPNRSGWPPPGRSPPKPTRPISKGSSSSTR